MPLLVDWRGARADQRSLSKEGPSLEGEALGQPSFMKDLEEMRQHHVDLHDSDVPGAGKSCVLTPPTSS